MIFALYRLGYHSKATIHGFRSTASTALNESGLFRPDVIERQLAHVERNQVRSAYNAALYLKERRQMMNWWTDRLLTMYPGASAPSEPIDLLADEPPAYVDPLDKLLGISGR
jgi:hypothetical protein